MEYTEIIELVKAAFDNTVVTEPPEGGAGPGIIYIDGKRIKEVLSFLKEDERTSFDSLMCLSAVDFPDRMEVVYHLHSFARGHKVTLKVKVDRESPSLPTVEAVYPVANFHEREAFDLFGIDFQGHSDLRRILLPEDWPGHPLRKDYTYPESYHGVKV